MKAEGERCPGESRCGDFGSAAGDTAEERRENACTACPLKATKQTPQSREVEEFLDRVERLVRLRDSQLGLPALNSLEREAVLLWDDAVAARERVYKAQAAESYALLVAITKGMAGG